jgi:hypothetical protein
MSAVSRGLEPPRASDADVALSNGIDSNAGGWLTDQEEGEGGEGEEEGHEAPVMERMAWPCSDRARSRGARVASPPSQGPQC